MPMYKEQTLIWADGTVLYKFSNPTMRPGPTGGGESFLEAAAYINRQKGLTVSITIDSVPGRSPFLHVSARCMKRDLTYKEIVHLKQLLFGDKFVAVKPGPFSTPGVPKVMHLTEATQEEQDIANASLN